MTAPSDAYSQRLADLRNVAAFLAWQEPHALCGGVRVADAFASFFRLLQLPEDRVREAVRPSERERPS